MGESSQGNVPSVPGFPRFPVPGLGLGDDEGSVFIAADYHQSLQLPTACTL